MRPSGLPALGCKQVLTYLIFLFLYFKILPGLGQEAGKRYEAFFRQKPGIKVDGHLARHEWGRAKKEPGFTFPWLSRKPPATAFFAQVSRQHLYFAFQVQDQDIVVTAFHQEPDVADGDRVELFFAANKDLKDYYCLEISPDGRVLDYRASFYRQFDDTWDFTGLQVAASRTPSGYVVEGRIPLAELKRLGLLKSPEKGACFFLGLYRAAYSRAGSDKPQVNWISWVQPNTAEPDFHVPSSFGTFCIGAGVAKPKR